jgi:hypothetical protein
MGYKHSPANAKLSAFINKMNNTGKSPARQSLDEDLVLSKDVPSRHSPEATEAIKKNISEGYKVESVTKKPGGISTVMEYKPEPKKPEEPINETPETNKGRIENKGKPRKQKVIKSKAKSKYLGKGGKHYKKPKTKRNKNVVTSKRKRL